MKYHYHTINTGHCSHHESDVDIYPESISAVLPILRSGGGKIPSFPCWCAFTATNRLAVLSVSAQIEPRHSPPIPIWLSYIYTDRETAKESLRQTISLAPDSPRPEKLPYPGIVTALLPSISLASQEVIMAMADFGKVAAVAWLLSPFPVTTNREMI